MVSDVISTGFWGRDVRVERDRPAPAPKASWPLMGDIVSHRAGIPEHLIQWRRAENAPDPIPE